MIRAPTDAFTTTPRHSTERPASLLNISKPREQDSRGSHTNRNHGWVLSRSGVLGHFRAADNYESGEDHALVADVSIAPKKKQEKMNLGEFLTNQSLGSWADEMDSQPIPAMGSGFGARDRGDRDGGERRAFTQPSWERSAGGNMEGRGGSSYGEPYPVAKSVLGIRTADTRYRPTELCRPRTTAPAQQASIHCSSR